jgi:hypothetical protein
VSTNESTVIGHLFSNSERLHKCQQRCGELRWALNRDQVACVLKHYRLTIPNHCRQRIDIVLDAKHPVMRSGMINVASKCALTAV